MQLKIEERQAGEVTLLELEGRLTLGDETTAYRERVKQLLDARRNKIIVRLQKISRLDSAGVGILLASVKSARSAGGDLRLLELSQQVRDVLTLIGVATKPDVVRIFLSEQEALDSFPPTMAPSGVPPV